MKDIRGKILWVDDEINQLRPHILFLKEKGYVVSTSNNGQDAINELTKNNYDLVLLDQFMFGLDGIETLKLIKEKDPSINVIMITKSEEEWLMDEAISEKISHLLIKPVNPSQIFMACKETIEKNKIYNKKVSNQYLNEFQEIESLSIDANSFSDWWVVYEMLTKWNLKIDNHSENSLIEIFNSQFENSNRYFTKFVEEKYSTFLQQNDGDLLSKDIFDREIIPLLYENKKVCFIVLEAMRLDQFYFLKEVLSKNFNIESKPSVSILPTATPFSRNAIFSGMYPDEFCDFCPDQLKDLKDGKNINSFENLFFDNQLAKKGFKSLKSHYHKIWSFDEGKKFLKELDRHVKNNIISIVVNFIDQLAYKRAQSNILKEIVPDESSYRKTILDWYEQSWLKETMKKLGSQGFTIILTSDHGSIEVQKPAVVSADKHSSDGIRYKYGRNINLDKRYALDIRNLAEFRLPNLDHQCNYLIAKNNYFFVYPNEKNKYAIKLNNSFQSGGISMQEMFVPIYIMNSK